MCVPFLLATHSGAQEMGDALKTRIKAAISKAAGYLKSRQKEYGGWSEEANPAISGLAVTALMKDPSRQAGEFSDTITKALDWIRSHQKSDGGIYAEGLSNYNTAINLLSLVTRGAEHDGPAIQAARNYLISQQEDF